MDIIRTLVMELPGGLSTGQFMGSSTILFPHHQLPYAICVYGDKKTLDLLDQAWEDIYQKVTECYFQTSLFRSMKRPELKNGDMRRVYANYLIQEMLFTHMIKDQLELQRKDTGKFIDPTILSKARRAYMQLVACRFAQFPFSEEEYRAYLVRKGNTETEARETIEKIKKEGA